MTFTDLFKYAHGILSRVSWAHWLVMGVVSLALAVILLIRKKCSVYGTIALGLAVFMGLFLLDTAVLSRFLGALPHGYGYTLAFHRLSHITKYGLVELIANIAVFVPFGFFLGEWLSSSNRTGSWRRVGLVTLAAFGLSLCIECLQLVLHVGFFEVTDLVMNMVGGVLGAWISVGFRKVMRGGKSYTLTPN